jgi:hypothetical protein
VRPRNPTAAVYTPASVSSRFSVCSLSFCPSSVKQFAIKINSVLRGIRSCHLFSFRTNFERSHSLKFHYDSTNRKMYTKAQHIRHDMYAQCEVSGDAIKGDRVALIFNPTDSTILKWMRSIVLRWMQYLHHSALLNSGLGQVNSV